MLEREMGRSKLRWKAYITLLLCEHSFAFKYVSLGALLNICLRRSWLVEANRRLREATLRLKLLKHAILDFRKPLKAPTYILAITTESSTSRMK